MFDIIGLGTLLIVAGFAVVVLALVASNRKTGGDVKGAGVLLIGPIPIIFGSDAKWTSVAIILAIVLVVIVLLFWV